MSICSEFWRRDLTTVKLCYVNPTRLMRAEMRALAMEMTRRGHEVTLIKLSCCRMDEELEHVGLAKVLDIRSFLLPKVRYPVPSPGELMQVLLRLIRTERVDVVHVGTHFYPQSIVASVVGSGNGTSVLATIDSLPGINWTYGSYGVDVIAKVFGRAFTRRVLRGFSGIAVLYPQLRESLIRLGVSGSAIRVIPNGVYVSRPLRRKCDLRKELGLDERTRVVLFVGRLVPVKGVPFLIRAFIDVARMEGDVILLLAGDGPYRSVYLREVGDRKDVRFLGWRNDVPDLIGLCDFLVLPSISEGLPSAVLEAGSLGKPVIASAVGGVPFLVEHGCNGFLVQPGDVKGLAEMMVRLLRDDDLRKLLGSGARKRFTKEFSWEEIAQRYEALYNSCIGDNSSK